MSWKESDPLSLWKASTTVPKPVDIQNFEKSNIVERFVGSRSKIWESLSEIPLHSRSLYLNKLFDVWPYWRERFAFEMPRYTMGLTSVATSAYISAKINADVFLVDHIEKLRFNQILRSCPTNAPVVCTSILSGLMFPAVLYLFYLRQPLVSDERPIEPWSVYTKLCTIYVISGVLLPLVSTPYISYYSYIRMNGSQDPNIHRNWMDYFTLSFEFSRSVRRRIPLLIGVQLAVAALCTSAMVWGRNRIFNTIGVSPDLIRGIMHDAFATEYETEKNKYTNRLNSFASKVVPYDLETEWKPPMAEEVHKNTLNTLERLKN